MKIIETDKVKPTSLKPIEREWVYNGLDCCVTMEVLDALLPQLDNLTAATYSFSRSLQGPVLEMGLRGVRVDLARKAEVIDDLYEKLDRLERQLDRIVLDGCGMRTFNWRSNPDLHLLFYTRLGIPPIKRKGRPTVDRKALEKLANYLIARPIVNHIALMREIGKKIGVLKTEIDPDIRIRTTYNIAGTETGRFSSSFSEFGTGTNLQNVEESIRPIFISDPGKKMAKFDAKSGESYCVGAIEWNLFKDGRYLDACESGDPHTATARICWPGLPWTGDLKRDKEIAEQPFYRHYSYRFMCKKIGHGSNYRGAPATLAEQAQIERRVIEQFQPKYFLAYPAHLRWHGWVEKQVHDFGWLISLSGRKRWFFGRRADDSTIREAIAYDPQCSLADIVNNGMLQVWQAGIVELYMQDHDAITVQYPEEQEDEIIPRVFKLLSYPVELAHGRTLTIPYDCKVGWNRGDYDGKTNPDGLRDYRPGDERRRTPPVPILDRSVHRAYG